MKRCPSCNRTYADQSLNFCLDDGTPLVNDYGGPDPHATVRYPSGRDTGEPPPTEIYREPMPMLNQVPELARPQQQPQPQWSPTPVAPKKKSGAVWWVLGGLAVVGIIGIGLVVMIIAIASLSANTNRNSNTNTRVVNRNGSANANRNTNSASSASPLTDDFSDQKWGSTNSQFGDTWYEDGEYHMRSKPKMFVVMYAPTESYASENATVKVRARSVDGTDDDATSYGLVIHGERKGASQMEDYAFLIYTGDEPKYQVVLHKDGNQTPLIGWTNSTIIRSGTSPNQLEARINGSEISFYINGQYVNRITDKENLRDGRVGFYTSDVAEVAFDDLEITPN